MKVSDFALLKVGSIKYLRRAWTGGDTPPKGFPYTQEQNRVMTALIEEQVAESGGLDLWECAGNTVQDRMNIFINRAILDTWRMFNP